MKRLSLLVAATASVLILWNIGQSEDQFDRAKQSMLDAVRQETALRRSLKSRPRISSPQQFKMLVGLRGCWIVVEDVSRDSPLSREEIQTIIEFQFRKAGIPLLGQYEGEGFFYLSVHLLKVKEPEFYCYALRAEWRERCVSVRTLLRRSAPVWVQHKAGYAGRLVAKRGTKQAIKELTDEFLNDYLKANPKH